MYGSVRGYALVRNDCDNVGRENDNNEETRWRMSATERHSNILQKEGNCRIILSSANQFKHHNTWHDAQLSISTVLWHQRTVELSID